MKSQDSSTSKTGSDSLQYTLLTTIIAFLQIPIKYILNLEEDLDLPTEDKVLTIGSLTFDRRTLPLKS